MRLCHIPGPVSALISLSRSNAGEASLQSQRISHTDLYAGAPYASACAANLIAYYNPEPYGSGALSTIYTTLFETTLTVTTIDAYAPTFWQTAECDGSTRVSLSYNDDIFVTGVVTLPTPEAITISTAYTVTEYSTIDIPDPTCTINPSDCLKLVTAFANGFSEISAQAPQASL